MNRNNWLDRYLGAVKTHLPARNADDLAAELRSSIEDEIEAREAEAGQPLTEAELLELLRRKGHPIRVASAYHERRSLVDEQLFPLFKRSLGLLLLGLLVLHLAKEVQGALAASAWSPLHVLIGFAWDYGHAALLAFAGLSLAFYAFQPQLRHHAGMDDWQPRSLPPADAGTAIGRGGSSFEFILSLLMLRLLNLDWIDPAAFTDLGLSGWSPDALPWLRLLSAVLLLSLALTASHLLSPHWTATKRWIDAALSLLGALILWRLSGLEALLQALDSSQAAALLAGSRTAVIWVGLFLLCDASYSAYQARKMAR